MQARVPTSISEVVASGLCIGCGLCAALQPGRWHMAYTDAGRLRPKQIGPGDDRAILAACPGAVARPNDEPAPESDAIWGGYHRTETAWATDPDIRFEAATGGVLTALGQHLLRSGQARFILHCAADPAAPMRSAWCISRTEAELRVRCGSRYGSSDTLAGLEDALSQDLPFAIIAKPCDAGAVRERARVDERLRRNLVALLVMVCGGASDLGKSKALLDEFGVDEAQVTLFRYRGHGNPGPTVVETRTGRRFTKSYPEMWADEADWRIQTRCKICPDALGEAADIAAADIWPGGTPVDDDAGFNGVITRTEAGEALYRAALAAGALTNGPAIGPRDLDHCQPHQVSKKHALAARLRGLSAAGSAVYAHSGLRIADLDHGDPAEEAGTFRRASEGRFTETSATGDT